MTADEYLKLAQLAHKQGDQATELKALKDWESNGGKARGIGTELGEGFKRFGEGIAQLAEKTGISGLLGYHGNQISSGIEARRAAVPEPVSTAGTIARGVGEYGPQVAAGLAIPVAGAEGLAARVGLNALTGGGLSAAAYTPPDQSKTTQALTGAALGGIIPEAGNLISKAAAPLFRAGNPARAERFAAFEQAGAKPTVGQITGGKTVQGIETVLGKTPGSRGYLTRHIEETQKNLNDSVEGIASRLSGGRETSPYVAGGEIKTGISDYITKFKKRSTELYSSLNNVIPKETPVPVSNTANAIDDILGRSPIEQSLTPGPVKTQLEMLKQNIQSGHLSFGDLQAARTKIGQGLHSFDLNPGISKADSKRLYGAITSDIKDAADSRGAGELFKQANDYYKQNANLISKTLNGLDRKAEPEKVYNALVAGTKDGAQKLKHLEGVLTPSQFNLVAATQLRKLGSFVRDGQEQFSGGTFLGNWGRLHNDAKQILYKDPEVRKGIDTLAQAMGTITEQQRQLANPSGTAGQLGNILFGGGIAAAAANPALITSFIGAALASNGAARLLTNQKFIKWLAQGPALRTPSAIRQWIARGSAIGIPQVLNEQ